MSSRLEEALLEKFTITKKIEALKFQKDLGGIEDVASQVGRFQTELSRMQTVLDGITKDVERIIDEMNRERAEDGTLPGSENMDEPQTQSTGKSAILSAVIKTKGMNSASVLPNGCVRIHKSYTLKASPQYDKSVGSGDTGGSRTVSTTSYVPNDEQLEKIRKCMDPNCSPDDVITVSYYASGTNIDRGGDSIRNENYRGGTALKDLEKGYKGYERNAALPFLINHDWTVESTKGKVYDAEIEGDKLRTDVAIPTYMTDVVKAIKMRLVDRVSVAFDMEPENSICSKCSKCMMSMDCPHFPGEKDEKGQVIYNKIMRINDVFELSGVAVPMNAEAEQLKSLDSPEEETSPTTKTILSDEEAEILANRIKSMLENPSSELTSEQRKKLKAIIDPPAGNVDTMIHDVTVPKGNEMSANDNQDNPEAKKTDETTVVDPAAPATAEPTTPEAKQAPEGEVETKADKKAAKLAKKALKSALKENLFMDVTKGLNESLSKLEKLSKDFEPLLTAHKALDEKMAALDAKLDEFKALASIVSNFSVDSLKSLTEPEAEEDNSSRSFVRNVFGSTNDLGGQ